MFDKIRSIVNRFRDHRRESCILSAHSEYSLLKSCPTRYCTDFLMAMQFFRMFNDMQRAVTSKAWVNENYQNDTARALIMDSSFYEEVHLVLRIVYPYIILLKLADSQILGASAIFFSQMKKVEAGDAAFLVAFDEGGDEENEDDYELAQEIADIKDKLAQNNKSYWNNMLDNPVIRAAHILNPHNHHEAPWKEKGAMQVLANVCRTRYKAKEEYDAVSSFLIYFTTFSHLKSSLFNIYNLVFFLSCVVFFMVFCLMYTCSLIQTNKQKKMNMFLRFSMKSLTTQTVVVPLVMTNVVNGFLVNQI